jgi:glycosyltransferase involved in cell wall biosynthesis
MSDVGVMHVLDSLALGGAERAAVNIVNALPRKNYRPYLCTTRANGPLRDAVSADVECLSLERKTLFDARAVRKLLDFIRSQDIRILHAHGSSLFIAALTSWFPPLPILIWHAHYGRVALEDHRAWVHRLAARRTRAVITVNHQLAEWCGRRLAVPKDRIWCIPNMVSAPATEPAIPDLPGTPGSRIVCVANLRPEKDHLNLVRAMALVVRRFPSAHLFFVGAHSDPAYSASSACFEAVKQEIVCNSLEQKISILGQPREISALLHGCDIGVLSSKTEGLPVSLLEYGMAGLPVVATRVGECEEVLDRGHAGLLVPPQSPRDLAEALLSLLASRERRTLFGERFLHRVQNLYSAKAIAERVCLVYKDVLASKRTGATCMESTQDGLRA